MTNRLEGKYFSEHLGGELAGSFGYNRLIKKQFAESEGKFFAGKIYPVSEKYFPSSLLRISYLSATINSKMSPKLKGLFLFFLKEKTAWPAVFILVVSLVNFVINQGFFASDNKLHLTTVRASASPTENSFAVSQSALKSASFGPTIENSAKIIYNKFLKNNFIIPTTGVNWGILHGKNGTDIADQCGKKIYAAEEGLVIEQAVGDWNDGYGNFIVIEHPNNIRTKYAHLKRGLVKKNSYVLQGDPIALIGNTGLTHGVTGCHLHFEVLGTENPFVK